MRSPHRRRTEKRSWWRSVSLCTITCADQARISNAWVAERVIGWCTDQTTRVRVGQSWDRGSACWPSGVCFSMDGLRNLQAAPTVVRARTVKEWPRFSTQGRQKEAPTRRDFRILQCGRLSLLFHKTEAASQREEGDGRGAVRLRRQVASVVWFHPELLVGSGHPPAAWAAGPTAAPWLACKGSTRRARGLLARRQKQVRS